MDTAYVPGQLHGTCTRLYGESSFDSLQITGDFVVVNLRESTARAVNNDTALSYIKIGRAVFDLINANGLKTVFGHDKMSDYDYDQDGKIDFMNFLIRNIKKPYSNLNPGSGYGHPFGHSLNIGGVYYTAHAGTIECVGDGDFYASPTNIVTHEISHGLFGTNDFHTSGGNHRAPGCDMSFLNIQGGYGLMGAAHSGLVCCNGYERWRMHWKHPDAPDYISARDADNTHSVVSDISMADGNRTFLLRDFVTYGDAVRIKLPYKDSETSSEQYIWLENHKVGSNGRLDYLQYSNTTGCRPEGSAGIYAYYQVGRDILEEAYGEVWDGYDRDNLKVISAEGFYDYRMLPDTYNLQCVAYGNQSYTLVRGAANPFCGYSDQEKMLFPEDGDAVLYVSGEFEPWRVVVDGQNRDNLPFLGDGYDAFTAHTTLNMGTNPSTCNTITYHANNSSPSSIISSRRGEKNTVTTYLSGLGIEMIPVAGTGDFIVNIRWDDYGIDGDARWTGTISLKDTAVLRAGSTITLAQNGTVAQDRRDAGTGLFAGKTDFTCAGGSYFWQDSASVLELTEKSEFTVKSGARYELAKGATLRVGAGCRAVFEGNSTVVLRGNVEVDSGGVLTVYDTVCNGKSAHLIVRPGGRLIVDGGTLTSACPGEMWPGNRGCGQQLDAAAAVQ